MGRRTNNATIATETPNRRSHQRMVSWSHDSHSSQPTAHARLNGEWQAVCKQTPWGRWLPADEKTKKCLKCRRLLKPANAELSEQPPKT